MNEKIRVLAIAPYETLGKIMVQAAKGFPQLELTVEVGCILEGVRQLKKHNLADFDAVLSRGGTKMEIEKNTTLPVFDVPISYYDLLNIIKLVEQYQGRVAILMYENIANSARVLCRLMQFSCDIYNIDPSHNAAEKVEMLKELGYSLIIGDAVSVEHAEKLGVQSILLTSGVDSVREAFERVVQSCSYLARYKRENQLYRNCHKAAREGFLGISSTGEVQYSTLPKDMYRLQTACRHLIPQVREERQMTVQKHLKEGFFEIFATTFPMQGEPFYAFRIKRQRFTTADNTPPYLTFYDAADHRSSGLPNILQLLNPSLWQQAQQAAEHHLPVCLSGAAGTQADQIVRQLFVKSSPYQESLFILDAALLKPSDIGTLCTAPHSPLFITDASIYFTHLEALGPESFAYLMDELTAASYTSTARFFFSLEEKAGRESLQDRMQILLDHFHALPVSLPTLLHKEDKILNYALLYIQHYNHLQDTHIVGMEPEATTLLCQYAWPQNLSQLQRVLRQAILSTDAPWITARTLRQILKNEERTFLPPPREAFDLNRSLDEIIHSIVLQVLQEENLNQTQTAQRLHISRTTLWRLLKEDKTKP